MKNALDNDLLDSKKSHKEKDNELSKIYEIEFEIAHKIVAKAEGELAEHKNDPGGLTKYGISLRFLEDYSKTSQGRNVLTKLRIFSVDRSSIVSLSKEQAKNILYNAFWKSPCIDKLPLILSVITYDYAVNSGSFYAVKVLQKALEVEIDGILGPITIHEAYSRQVPETAKKMLEERAKFYIRLSQQKPKLKVFLKGWLNRIEDLKDYVNGLSKSMKNQKLMKQQLVNFNSNI